MKRRSQAIGRVSMQWCATHQTRYTTWADKGKTKLNRCPGCIEDDERYAKAVELRKPAEVEAGKHE